MILAADSEATVAFVSLVLRALAESLGPDELARLREASREDLSSGHRIRNQWRLHHIVDGWWSRLTNPNPDPVKTNVR